MLILCEWFVCEVILVAMEALTFQQEMALLYGFCLKVSMLALCHNKSFRIVVV
jgi:hypothetical protein